MRVSESSDLLGVQRQAHAQHAPLTDRPSAEQADRWDRSTEAGAASRGDGERPKSTAAAAARSAAIRVCTSEKIPGGRSPSPPSRPRRKSPVSFAGITRHFRRGKLLNQAAGGRTTREGQQRSSAGEGDEDSNSTDTNGRHVDLPLLDGDQILCASEDVVVTEREEEEAEAAASFSALLSKPGRRPRTGGIGENPVPPCFGASCCEAGGPGQSKAQRTATHLPPAAKRVMSRDWTRVDVGADALEAVKAGQQSPRIAFIGVFLSGVAVALASFVPFGAADARTALVKAVRRCRSAD